MKADRQLPKALPPLGRRRFSWLLAFSVLVVACGQAAAERLDQAAPTWQPDPEVAAPSTTPVIEAGSGGAADLSASTPTPAPYNLATPAVLIERPAAPTDTPLPPPAPGMPSAAIRIFRPGPGSQVTSPFQVFGRGGPSYRERVGIRLIGEDGRVVSERLTYLLVYPGRAGNFVAQVEFEIPWLAEAARLEVFTEDLRYGRLAQLASVDVVLLSRGTQLLHPQLEGPEKLAIFEPREGAIAQGNLMVVRGAGWIDSELPLTVELLDRSGQPLVSQQVPLDSLGVGQLGTFEVALSYQIPFSQYGRVVVYEPSAGIPGIRHYSSVEVWLQQ